MTHKQPAPFTLHPGTAPLVLSLPHVGTWLPDVCAQKMVPRALAVEDTDWHLEALYSFVREELGASVIVPSASRYWVDLNRPPENAPMYPGVNNTELCPTRFFTGEPLYQAGCEPSAQEVQSRVAQWWQPYHSALADELSRLRALHGHVVLWDGHSIKGTLPWLFEGRLPDLNLGTANATSCAGSLRSALCGVLRAQTHFTHVADGRFKGGYITRQYGRPAQQVHAVQLEMVWSTYMAELQPYEIDPTRAARITPVLHQLLSTCVAWRP